MSPFRPPGVRRPRRAAPAAVALAIALVGCSGAPESEPSAAESPAATVEPSPRPSPATTPSAGPAAPATPEPSPPVPAEPAGDPAGLAAQLVWAERTVRSDGPPPADLRRAGHLQQAAYRILAARPEWRAPFLAAVPGDLHPVVAAHVDAAEQLYRLTTPQGQLPAWRIVPPPPPEELLAHYREAEQVFGVGWQYLAAIHLVETRMGRIRGTSPAGAQGPMQFMPATWDAYGEGDINDPRDAILAAARYLAANGAPATMDNALFRYNRSDAYVHAITTYAQQMAADPRTYHGYYHWQVYYRTTAGDRLLPEGYDGTAG